MKTSFKKKLLGQLGLVTGTGALLSAVGIAQASMICTTSQCTDTQSFSVTSSPVIAREGTGGGTNPTSDPQSTTATFEQFDSSLGTLIEIDFSLSSTLFGDLIVSAGAHQSSGFVHAEGTASWDASYSLALPGSLGFSDTKSTSVNCTAASTTGHASCTVSKDPSPSFAVTWSDVQTLQSILDMYTGAGTFDATFNLNLMLTALDQGSGATSGATASGSATWDPPPIDGLTVTYIFTPSVSTVPEPATIALLALGSAGLGFARRRTRAIH